MESIDDRYCRSPRGVMPLARNGASRMARETDVSILQRLLCRVQSLLRHECSRGLHDWSREIRGASLKRYPYMAHKNGKREWLKRIFTI
jgi:hypothetical protein